MVLAKHNNPQIIIFLYYIGQALPLYFRNNLLMETFQI